MQPAPVGRHTTSRRRTARQALIPGLPSDTTRATVHQSTSPEWLTRGAPARQPHHVRGGTSVRTHPRRTTDAIVRAGAARRGEGRSAKAAHDKGGRTRSALDRARAASRRRRSSMRDVARRQLRRVGRVDRDLTCQAVTIRYSRRQRKRTRHLAAAARVRAQPLSRQRRCRAAGVRDSRSHLAHLPPPPETPAAPAQLNTGRRRGLDRSRRRAARCTSGIGIPTASVPLTSGCAPSSPPTPVIKFRLRRA
jgi:hypothetical protein